MYTSETKIRVRYGETDQMGFAYYGNYAEYYEVARVESLRQLGMSYKSLEEKGILLPVYTFSIKYLKPAFYDDELIIKTTMSEIPKARIVFQYETYNIKNELLNTGEVVLVFCDKKSMKPVSAPDYFIEKVGKYFK